MWKRGKLGFAIILLEMFICVAMILRCEYDPTADASNPMHSYSPALGGLNPDRNPSNRLLYHFLNNTMLPLIGLGLILAGLLDGTTLTGLGFNYMVFVLASQWSLLCPDFFLRPTSRTQIGLTQLMQSTRNAFAVTITNGLLHGLISPLQLLVMAMIEVPIISILQHHLDQWKVADSGDSLSVYLFAIYFGVGLSCAQWPVGKVDMCREKERPSSFGRPVYKPQLRTKKDVFKIDETFGSTITLIGCITIYTFYPCLMASTVSGDRQHRFVITTSLSLGGSTLSSFAFSSLVDRQNRLSVDHLRVGVLSGAVAMSCVGYYMIYPYTALLIGMTIGASSCAIHHRFHEHSSILCKLPDRVRLQASIGFPSLVSNLIAVGLAFIADETTYGYTLYELFPARAFPQNSSELDEIQSYLDRVGPGVGRSALNQAVIQLLGTLIALLLSLASGLVTGLVLALPIFDPISKGSEKFQDSFYWVSKTSNRQRGDENTYGLV